MPVTTATHKPRAILSPLFVTVLIDHLDRSNLAIAGSESHGRLAAAVDAAAGPDLLRFRVSPSG